METSAPLIDNLFKHLIKLFVSEPLFVVFGDIDFSDGFSEYIFKNNVIKTVTQAFFRGLRNTVSPVVDYFPAKGFEFFDSNPNQASLE